MAALNGGDGDGDVEDSGRLEAQLHPSATAAAASEQTQAHAQTASGLRSTLVVLALLTLQNSSLPLMMKYSRVVENHAVVGTAAAGGARGGGMYTASTAVACAEAAKIAACCAVLLVERRLGRVVRGHVLDDRDTMVKLAVPSVLYTVQNNLNYLALSTLQTTTFQVTSQLKILTTGLFSVVLLRRQLGRTQWLSMALLATGVVLVQLSPEQTRHGPTQPSANNGGSAPTSLITLGLAAVLTSCAISGFAGVYFEKVLKATNESIWVANLQLGLIGLPLSLLVVMVNDSADVLERGFFAGYTPLTWAIIANQAIGGLLVAAVVKQANSIVKAYATSIAIIISTGVSFWLYDLDMPPLFLAGVMAVILAVYLYARP